MINFHKIAQQSSGLLDNIDSEKPIEITRKITTLFIRVCMMVGLFYSLVACTTPNQNTPSHAQTTPTEERETPTPAPQQLYKADWSHGSNGWQLGKHWHIKNGMIESDQANDLVLTIPYQPSVSDYTVEFDLQVGDVPRGGGYFWFTAQKHPGKDGYQAGVLNILKTGVSHPFAVHGQIQIFVDPMDSMGGLPMQTSDYDPGANWHTYSITVQKNVASLYDDGVRSSRAISTVTHTLSTGPLQLKTGNATMRVRNFHITTP